MVSPYIKVNYVISSTGNFGKNIREILNSHQEVLALRDQNQKLIHDLVKLKTLEIENKRLSELLGCKRKIGRKTIVARVIAKTPQQYYKSMIIDKGSDDGLADNMAVFGFYKCRFGVIGQLINVEKNVSVVLTITNRISKVPARVISASVDGLVIGCETDELGMIWIPADAEIKIGDEVVTSSASDIFPTGIPIGIITAVCQTGDTTFKKASVKPLVNAFQVTDVFIE